MTATNWVKATDALGHVDAGLEVIGNLMGYVKPGQGKPSAKERALFAASIVFTYGIWENYVEQLALELSGKVAPAIKPDAVPAKIRKQLEGKTPWELSVSPGWRALWIDIVKAKALGDEKEKFGMNTARAGQVSFLMEIAGVEDAFKSIADSIAPIHLEAKDRTAKGAVDALVTLRGEIVHTGKVPATLSKSHVTAWKDFVNDLTKAMDKSCREQCANLLT
ncbi:MAG: hypothetical protein ACSLEY_00245 [Candidatus Saccharimonadales bacterium]